MDMQGLAVRQGWSNKRCKAKQSGNFNRGNAYGRIKMRGEGIWNEDDGLFSPIAGHRFDIADRRNLHSHTRCQLRKRYRCQARERCEAC